MRPAALTTYACVMPWDVGPVRISRVVESVLPFAVDFFAEATPDDVAAEGWLVPDFVDADGRYQMSIQTLAVEAQGRRIVVDTCVGNAKERPLSPEFDNQDGPFIANLTAAGFDPDRVDTVICTHLHFDHVGWKTRLVDGKWIPTFPLARYLFGAADIDYWSRSTDPLHSGAFVDSVQPLFDAGLVDPIAEGTAITADMRLTLTPGHTPGHLSVWIGDRCVITGVVLHHPIQVRHPKWTARGDVDPDLARATRSQVLATSATNNALLLGTYFAGTGAGRVFATEDSYRFTAEVGS